MNALRNAAWLCLAMGSVLCAQEAVQSPVGPRDSLKHFEIHPGLKIELVACEPQVVDPVAIRFDEAGHMWVVEMRDYPHGPGDGQQPKSRIRILRDRDHDGFYESAVTFADHLLFANGVQPWTCRLPDGQTQSGVIVTLGGRVQFMCDTDRDDRADVVETWFEGFRQENPQLRANDPTLGPDGWVYIANGLRNGVVRAVRSDWADQPAVTLKSQDFRFHPQTGKFEAISGYGQFGMSFDDYGNRFVCSNRNPNNHVVMPQRYLNRNPFLIRTDAVEVVSPAGPDSRVFAISKPWTTSTLHAGQFTAACGVTIFRGNRLPESFYGNSFTCEPTGNLVHRDILTAWGPTFRSQPGREGVEFLASRDNWFRPVNLANAPDGNLYVVDMYRAVIEHPQFMPAELKVRRDLRSGDDRGRIYRVVAAGRTDVPRAPTLKGADETQLLKIAASHENGWHRDTARRLLRHAGYSEEKLPAPATHKAAAVFRQLLSLGEQADAAAAARQAASLLAKHPHPRHEQAVLTFPPEAGLELLTQLTQHSGTDPAVATLAQQIALRNDDTQTLSAMALVAGLPAGRNEAALLGLGEGLRRRGKRLGVLAAKLPEPARGEIGKLFSAAAARLSSGSAAEQQRALRVVQHATAEFAAEKLIAALDTARTGDVQAAVIEALAPYQSAALATRLLEGFQSQTPRLQRAIVASCAARPESALTLARSVLSGSTPPTAIDSAAQKTLKRYQQPELKAAVSQVMAALVPADRREVMSEYADCVSLESDPQAGRAVFVKNCATCHRIGSIGVDIAPDIADSRTRTPEYLLTNILDPNRAVDANYFSYTAVLTDGRIVTGIVASETASSITLKQPEGKTIRLLRSNIDEFKCDGVSLMPAGLEKNITKQQMADLISFIKNWRYLDGDIPIDVR